MEDDEAKESFLNTDKDEVDSMDRFLSLTNELDSELVIQPLSFDLAEHTVVPVSHSSLDPDDDVFRIPSAPPPRQPNRTVFNGLELAFRCSPDPNWWVPPDSVNVSSSKNGTDLKLASSWENGRLVSLAPNSENFVRITNNQIVHAGRQPPPGVQANVPLGQYDAHVVVSEEETMPSSKVTRKRSSALVKEASVSTASLFDIPWKVLATSSKQTALKTSFSPPVETARRTLTQMSLLSGKKLVRPTRPMTTVQRAPGSQPHGVVPQLRMQVAGARARASTASPHRMITTARSRKSTTTATITSSGALNTTATSVTSPRVADSQRATLVAVNATTTPVTGQTITLSQYPRLRNMLNPAIATLIQQVKGDFVMHKIVLSKKPPAVSHVTVHKANRAEIKNGAVATFSGRAHEMPPTSVPEADHSSPSSICEAYVLESHALSSSDPRVKCLTDALFDGEPATASFFITSAERVQPPLSGITEKEALDSILFRKNISALSSNEAKRSVVSSVCEGQSPPISTIGTMKYSLSSDLSDGHLSSYSLLLRYMTGLKNSQSEQGANKSPTCVVDMTCSGLQKAKYFSLPYDIQPASSSTTFSTQDSGVGHDGTISLQWSELSTTTTAARACGNEGLQTRAVSSRGRPIILTAKSQQLAESQQLAKSQQLARSQQLAQITTKRKTSVTSITPHTLAPVLTMLSRNSDGSVTMGNEHGETRVLYSTGEIKPGPFKSTVEQVHSDANYDPSPEELPEQERLERKAYRRDFDYSQPMVCPNAVLDMRPVPVNLHETVSADGDTLADRETSPVVSALSVHQRETTSSAPTYLAVKPHGSQLMSANADVASMPYVIQAAVSSVTGYHTIPIVRALGIGMSGTSVSKPSATATSQQQSCNVIVSLDLPQTSNSRRAKRGTANRSKKGTKRRN